MGGPVATGAMGREVSSSAPVKGDGTCAAVAGREMAMSLVSTGRDRAGARGERGLAGEEGEAFG